MELFLKESMCPHPEWEGGNYHVRINVESERFPDAELVADTNINYFPWERYGNGRDVARDQRLGVPVHTVDEARCA